MMYLVVNSDEIPSVTVLDKNHRKQLVGVGGGGGWLLRNEVCIWAVMCDPQGMMGISRGQG